MSSFGRVPLQQIWAMLDRCAPGHARKLREHNYVVYFQGLSYPSLPVGEHGKRENPSIQIGKIKQMVRQLGLNQEPFLDCVRRLLPQLRL